MYYLIAFIIFFVIGYKVRGLLEIYKIVKIKNYVQYCLDNLPKQVDNKDKEGV